MCAFRIIIIRMNASSLYLDYMSIKKEKEQSLINNQSFIYPCK